MIDLRIKTKLWGNLMKRDKSIIVYIFLVVFIIVGSLVIYFSINPNNNYDKFVKDAEYTVAEVSDIVHNSYNDSLIYYIKYTVDEVEYEVEAADIPFATNIGEKVGIYYDRDNPERYMIKENHKEQNYGVLFIGIIFVSVGILGLILNVVERLRREKIIKNGYCVEAEIVNIDLALSDFLLKMKRYNRNVGTDLYIIIVYCTHPFTGISNTYKSQILSWNPNLYYKIGDKVPIYFDRNNDSKYYIDFDTVKKNGIEVFDNSI